MFDAQATGHWLHNKLVIRLDGKLKRGRSGSPLHADVAERQFPWNANSMRDNRAGVDAETAS